MTGREKEIFNVVKELGGSAHPTRMAHVMGISSDYATQLSRDMVWMGYFKKKGLHYELSPAYRVEVGAE